jgi:hypothetical protein
VSCLLLINKGVSKALKVPIGIQNIIGKNRKCQLVFQNFLEKVKSNEFLSGSTAIK